MLDSAPAQPPELDWIDEKLIPGPLIPNFVLSGPPRRDILNAMRAVRELPEASI